MESPAITEKQQDPRLQQVRTYSNATTISRKIRDKKTHLPSENILSENIPVYSQIHKNIQKNPLTSTANP